MKFVEALTAENAKQIEKLQEQIAAHDAAIGRNSLTIAELGDEIAALTKRVKALENSESISDKLKRMGFKPVPEEVHKSNVSQLTRTYIPEPEDE